MAGSLFSDISNFVNNQLGIDDSVSGFGRSENDGHTPPWGVSGQRSAFIDSEAFWKPTQLDPGRWNQLFPYRLLVVDVSKGGVPRIVVGTSSSVSSHVSQIPREKGIEYVTTQVAESNTWEMVLPITPQQLNITDQFAINNTATMRGVVEEHGGVRFKMINVAGTTGIWPKRPTRGGSIKSPTSLGSIFAGTLGGIGALSQNVQGIARAFSGQHPNSVSPSIKPEEHESTNFSTGYYQALYLGQFLERYAQAKKNPKFKGWRLVLDMPKRNESYIVTPVTYTSSQNQQKPNEYLFNMQLKAWKRVDLNSTKNIQEAELPKLEANVFQRIVRTIGQVRKTLSTATNLVKAVRSDFQRVFNVLRQTSLAVKDLGGLAFSVADLPNQLVGDFKSTIEESVNNVKGSFKRGPSNPSGGAVSSANSSRKSAISIKTSSSTAKAGAAADAIVQRNQFFEGLSADQVAAGALGGGAVQSLATDSLNDIFDNPEENFELFDEINVDTLTLTPEQQQAFEDELERIQLITVDDLRDFKQEMLDLALQISNNFGAGDQVYSDVYGRQDPKERVADMTVEENEILAEIYEAIQAYDLLTSTKQWDDFNIESPLEYVGGLANEAGIDFEDFPSKMLIPVPFDLTIEEIAARHMGDADKWIEIVTLNNMKSPYIDEEGFVLEFLSNAESRQFNINDTENRLYLGQRVILQSDIVPPFARKIIDIEKIGDDNILITVDGDGDLDKLKFVNNARMQGYLPGTVNSQNQIYIPTDLPSSEDDRTFDVPGINESNLVKLSKIDFLLTENNDVALNSVGEFRLANGLTNLIQAMKLKIITQRGTLLRHLSYGLGLSAGVSVADIEGGAIISSLDEMVTSDNRFDGIKRIDISLLGSTMKISMSVTIANNSGVVPITFEVPAA